MKNILIKHTGEHSEALIKLQLTDEQIEALKKAKELLSDDANCKIYSKAKYTAELHDGARKLSMSTKEYSKEYGSLLKAVQVVASTDGGWDCHGDEYYTFKSFFEHIKYSILSDETAKILDDYNIHALGSTEIFTTVQDNMVYGLHLLGEVVYANIIKHIEICCSNYSVPESC